MGNTTAPCFPSKTKLGNTGTLEAMLHTLTGLADMAHCEENDENWLAVTRPVPPAPSVLTNREPQQSPSGNQVTPLLVRTTQPSAILAYVHLALSVQWSAAPEMWPGQRLFTCGSKNI